MPRMCPRCQIELKEKQNKGVTLDACDKCHGLWFDANEIDQVADKKGLTEWLRGAARACPQPVCPWCQHPQTRHGSACEKCGGAVGAICPVCQVWMPAFEVKGITVDFCVRCAGLWLDANELEQLTAATSPVPSVAATAPTALASPGSQPAIPAAATAPTVLAPTGAQPATARRPRYHAPVDAAAPQPAATPPSLPPTVSVPPPQAPPPQQSYQPPPQGYQQPQYQQPQYQQPPQGYQQPQQGYQQPPQGYQQPQYQQPPPGYQPAPGYQQAPAYVQSPIHMVQPQPYVATPVVSAPMYYDPYWAAYPGYYAAGPGYWYDGYYYDPYYGVGTGLAVGAAMGVGAVASAAMFGSVFDVGFGFW